MFPGDDDSINGDEVEMEVFSNTLSSSNNTCRDRQRCNNTLSDPLNSNDNYNNNCNNNNNNSICYLRENGKNIELEKTLKDLLANQESLKECCKSNDETLNRLENHAETLRQTMLKLVTKINTQTEIQQLSYY